MMDLFEEARSKTALDLLDLLNMDRKPNEQYHPQFYFQHGDYFVVIVANKEKEMLCNVVDFYGEVPSGMSVCWRHFSHIKRELKIPDHETKQEKRRQAVRADSSGNNGRKNSNKPETKR